MKPILIILILVLLGCNTERYCNKHGFDRVTGNDTIIKDSIVERETMVPIYVASDSGYLKAWIDCINSKPVITQVTEYKPGNNVKPSVTLSGNVLTAKCRVDSFAVFAKYREKEVYRNSRIAKTYVKITNVLTGWQWFWIRFGQITGLILLFWLGVKYGWPVIKKMITKV